MHPFFGHLIAVGKIASKLPQRAHTQQMATYLMRKYDLPGVFHLDARPISGLAIFVTDP
jgi:hypothetical protein